VSKTILSRKGQVVIPKQTRDSLGLTPGTVLKVQVEGKKVILEPLHEPLGIFIDAGPEVTSPILSEAKSTSDKTRRLLHDLGVKLE